MSVSTSALEKLGEMGLDVQAVFLGSPHHAQSGRPSVSVFNASRE
jgi:hypothetical protein